MELWSSFWFGIWWLVFWTVAKDFWMRVLSRELDWAKTVDGTFSIQELAIWSSFWLVIWWLCVINRCKRPFNPRSTNYLIQLLTCDWFDGTFNTQELASYLIHILTCDLVTLCFQLVQKTFKCVICIKPWPKRLTRCYNPRTNYLIQLFTCDRWLCVLNRCRRMLTVWFGLSVSRKWLKGR